MGLLLAIQSTAIASEGHPEDPDEQTSLQKSQASHSHSSYESFVSDSDEFKRESPELEIQLAPAPQSSHLEERVFELERQLARFETYVQAQANPPITPSDFLLPLATTLMFAGSALDEFYWFPEMAGWCFVVGGGIFMFYGCRGLGGKIYRQCCGIKRDPLPPL